MAMVLPWWKIKYSSKCLELPNSFRNGRKNFYCHSSGTTTATEVVKFYFRHHGTTAALPADDLADYHLIGIYQLVQMKNKPQFYLNPRLDIFCTYQHHQQQQQLDFCQLLECPKGKEFISYSDAACANLGQVLLLKPGHYSLSNLTQHNFSTIQI